MIDFANWLVTALGIYVALGVAFAAPFVLRGAARIDPAARDVTVGFRLIIVPAVVTLWPILLRRWLAGRHPREERFAFRPEGWSFEDLTLHFRETVGATLEMPGMDVPHYRWYDGVE